jgi:zinc/manganese transport system permease protein
MIAIAIATGILSGYAGLLLSLATGVPAGPAVILAAGVLYAASILFGRVGGVIRPLVRRRHLEA